MSQRIFIFLTACLLTVTFADLSHAQRRGFDVEGYLKRIDRNQNGRLEEDEMNDRTKDFIRKMGIDVDRPVSIKKVVAKVNDDREKRETDAKKKNTPELKVPGFGVAAKETGGGIPAFGVSAESGSPQAKKVEYSESINRQIEDALNRYDKNKDGLLDAEEIENGRWGNPKPSESDLNKDGRLTRDELARRYLARESYYNRERNKSSSSSDARSSRTVSTPSRTSSSSRFSSRSRSPSRTTLSRTSSTPTTNSKSTSSSSSAAKYERYASSLINQYDKNKNGKLEKEEVAEMRRPPKADADNDGVITKEELMDNLMGKKPSSGADENDKDSKSKSTTASKSRTSSSTRYSRPRRSSSFDDLDKNQDGKIHMHEFASDWTEELVDEFNEKDKDGDGHISEAEFRSK